MHIHRCKYMLTCTHTNQQQQQKKRKRIGSTHTLKYGYDSRHWSPCWGWGCEPLWFLWVWWSWWTDNTGHMKHKDSEEMLSGVTLLEVYSHIHTVMKEKSKKEVEGEMRILQQLLEDEGRGGRGVEGEGKWLWMANPVRRIYKRQHDGFIWILHDLNTGGGGAGDHITRTWSGWWLLMFKPDLQREMQPAAKKSRAASYSLYQTNQRRFLFQLRPPFFQVSSVRI